MGAAHYGADDLTDRSERFLAAELIREKLFRILGDELPYESTVVIEYFEVVKEVTRINATDPGGARSPKADRDRCRWRTDEANRDPKSA